MSRPRTYHTIPLGQYVRLTTKPHSCTWCPTTLDPGTWTIYTVNLWEGEFVAVYWCLPCWAYWHDTYRGGEGEGDYYVGEADRPQLDWLSSAALEALLKILPDRYPAPQRAELEALLAMDELAPRQPKLCHSCHAPIHPDRTWCRRCGNA